MNNIWSLNLDEYFEIVERAKKAGLQPGDSMEEILEEYMKEKGRLPIAQTDKDIDQLTGDLREEGLKILNMNEVQRQKDKNNG